MTFNITNYINQTVMATTERAAEKICCTSTALLAGEVVMANRKCTNLTAQTAAAHVTHVHTSSRSRVMKRITVVVRLTIWISLKTVQHPSATAVHKRSNPCHCTIRPSTSTVTNNWHFPKASRCTTTPVVTTVICFKINNPSKTTTTKDMSQFAMQIQ